MKFLLCCVVLLSALKVTLVLLTIRLFFPLSIFVGVILNSTVCVYVCMCVDMFLYMCSMIETKVRSQGSGGKWLVLSHRSLLLGSLLPVILEGHVWESIEGERIL